MAIATTTFTGFRPEAIDFLAELAQNNERAWFQPRKADFEALLKRPDGGLRGRPRRRARAAVDPAPGRPGPVDLPDLSRHPVRQGQVPLQDPSRGELPVDRRRRSATRAHTRTAATSTSSRATTTRAAGCGWRRRPGSRPSGARSSMTRSASSPPSRIPGSSRRSGRSPATSCASGSPPGWPKDHPRAEWFRFKDIVFGRNLTDDEVGSPELPVVIAEGYAAAMPVFRFLATLRD